MCPNDLYLNRLLNHVVEHMEEISLFVLPVKSEGDDDDAGSRAMQGSRTGDNPGVHSAASETSICFSAPDVTERPPEYEQNFK